jgi:hypothetical protein
LEINAFNYEISRSVRNARLIADVQDDKLELQVYDFASHPLPSPYAIQHPRRVVYRYDASSAPVLVKEVYSSTDTATGVLLGRTEFFHNQQLAPPGPGRPYFESRYMVGGAVVGIRVTVRVKSPLFRQESVPAEIETSVYGEGL